jgi:hypothetical protein
MLAVARRRQTALVARMRLILLAAAIPTALTLALEWLKLSAVSNIVRAVAAAPLGAAVAWVLLRISDGANGDRRSSSQT